MEESPTGYIPNGDWHTTIPTEEELKESLEKAKAELPMEESLSGEYATPERFVMQYSQALQDYLEITMGESKHHLGDLSETSKAFAQAFACITNWF